MRFARDFAVFICISVLASLPAAASNLVTGNGFGFAVVSPSTSKVTCFWAHPYSFAQPDPRDPLSEGIPTANFIKSVAWIDGDAHGASSAEYEEDSNVIHARNGAGEGFVFMPFTTLAYAYAVNTNGSVTGGYLALVIFAALLDVGTIGGGGRRVKRKVIVVKRQA